MSHCCEGSYRCCCFDSPFPDDLLTVVIVTLNPSQVILVNVKIVGHWLLPLFLRIAPCCFDLPFPDDLLTVVIVTLNPSQVILVNVKIVGHWLLPLFLRIAPCSSGQVPHSPTHWCDSSSSVCSSGPLGAPL
jgi:hypothetical protein